jgi:hypothetical protein
MQRFHPASDLERCPKMTDNAYPTQDIYDFLKELECKYQLIHLFILSEHDHPLSACSTQR